MGRNFAYMNTVSNKSFEGEKFRGLLGPSGAYVGKGFAIFSIATYIMTFMVFQLYKTVKSI